MQLKKTIQNNLFPFIVFMILVAGCCFAWYFFHPSSPYHARYRFVVSYQTIGTLSPGNRVIVRGIERGKILAVELTDDAVFVTVEVLAEAKISRHSQFRLINAGLMGEREMCVLTAEDQDWIADGDTVYGSFDDGLSGLGDVLSKAIADLDEMKGTLTALKDSVTIGSSGKRLDRIAKKSQRIVNAGSRLASDVREQALAVFDKGEATLEKARAGINEAAASGSLTVEKASALLAHVDTLIAEVKELKAGSDSLVARLDSGDNTVGLIASGRGGLTGKLEKFANDIDALIRDVKKSGLRLNIDIF